MDLWDTFGDVTGAASAALVGLLFVAVSINRDRFTQHPSLRIIAGQTLLMFMLPLVIAILLATPQQPSWALGGEFILLAVFAGVSLLISGRGKQTLDTQLAQLLDKVSLDIITTVFILIAGVTLVVGRGGGLYWIVPAVICALSSGVASAWLFLIRDPD